MLLHVRLQKAIVGVRLATFIAHVRFLVCMNSFVDAQRVRCLEALFAGITFVGSLAGVHHHMFFHRAARMRTKSVISIDPLTSLGTEGVSSNLPYTALNFGLRFRSV